MDRSSSRLPRLHRPAASLLAYAACAAALLIALAGCSGPKATTAPGMPAAFPTHSASEIRANIAASQDTLQRYEAKARVTVKSPQRSGSFNANVRQRRADSLLMSFNLFGIEGARMLMTPDSFFVYDKRKQQVMVGSIRQAEQVLPVPVSGDRVFENMLGLIQPESAVDWEVSADSTLYFLTDPSTRTQVTVDPRRWRVIRYARKSADGTVVEERLFHGFTRVDGVEIPQRILFRRPADDMMAELRYKEIDLTPGSLSFDLGAGRSIPRVGVPTPSAGR
jgi:outer membrane lipoprotein-sorting protein